MEDHLIKRLIATIKCGTCGENYREDHVEIIERNEDVWFLKVSCAACRGKSLVAAVIKNEKKCRAVSDLSAAEITGLKHPDEVGEDDILDMHRFLNEFDGDFAGLFSKE
jgi:hypothetical protein